MGQAMRKITGSRGPSVLKGTVPESQRPMESRFQDPNLRGHLPGDVHPEPPRPHLMTENEWDKSDPMYNAMIKDLAGSVVTKQQKIGGKGEGAVFRRPLPKDRHGTGFSIDENAAVSPGTLNVGHVRQIFLSYQGLIEGEKPMDAKALAEKYKVDLDVLSKMLKFSSIPDTKNETKTATQDSATPA